MALTKKKTSALNTRIKRILTDLILQINSDDKELDGPGPILNMSNIEVVI